MTNNEALSARFLDVPILKVRNSDHLDFHEVGIVSVRRMVVAAAAEAGFTYTEDEVTHFIQKHLYWGGPAVELNSGVWDFQEVSVTGIKNLLNAVTRK